MASVERVQRREVPCASRDSAVFSKKISSFPFHHDRLESIETSHPRNHQLQGQNGNPNGCHLPPLESGECGAFTRGYDEQDAAPVPGV